MGRLWARERMAEFWKITTETVGQIVKNLNLSSFVCSPPSKDYNLELSQIDYWESEEWMYFMVQKRLREKTWKARQNSDWCRIIQLYISGKRTCRQSSIRKNVAWQVEVERTEKWKWKKQNMTPATWGSKQKVKVKRTQDDISKFSVRTPPSLHGHTNCIRYKPSFASFQNLISMISADEKQYNEKRFSFECLCTFVLFQPEFKLNFIISIKAQIRTGTTKTFFISLQSDLWCKVLKRVINERKWSRINFVAKRIRKYFYFCWQIMSDSC